MATGVVRPAFSTKYMEARQWLLDRMGAAGLKASMDGVGNVIGRSSNPGKGILIGSHTDTQPQGGWLDGSLGVLYRLEIMRAFAEEDIVRGCRTLSTATEALLHQASLR